MIINIPLQIDEKKMEEVLERDYSGKILDRIDDYIKTTLKTVPRGTTVIECLMAWEL